MQRVWGLWYRIILSTLRGRKKHVAVGTARPIERDTYDMGVATAVLQYAATSCDNALGWHLSEQISTSD